MPSVVELPRGPLFTDVEGLTLTPDDIAVLQAPIVGGIILFARNYQDKTQLAALVASIRAVRKPELLIAVDHEGGRVQRFREGFTEIPAMRTLGDLWDSNAPAARVRAFEVGQTIGHELGDVGIDFSFAPVLDLDYGASTVIGHRAFHRNPLAAAALATSLIQGLRSCGMASVGKHFPGHGYVRADSHLDLPIDKRSMAELRADDIVPFAELIHAGIDAIMPAHVQYKAVDAEPACYSPFWLKTILRDELGFKGIVFSDDLGMVGAHTAGDIVARADAAISAGCDMVLACNDRPAALDLIARWKPAPMLALAARAERMALRH